MHLILYMSTNKCLLLPVDVVILMHAVKLQFKATQQVLNHDPQVMIKNPCAETGEMLSLRLKFHQQAVKCCVHLFCLQIKHNCPQNGWKIKNTTKIQIRCNGLINMQIKPSCWHLCLTCVVQNAKAVVLCMSPHPAGLQTLQECDPVCLSAGLCCVRGSESNCKMALWRIHKRHRD